MSVRTWKRETAALMLLTLLGFSICSLWFPPALEVLKILVYPATAFAGGAFGMHAYSTQVLAMKK